jgi:hypothetical protein
MKPFSPLLNLPPAPLDLACHWIGLTVDDLVIQTPCSVCEIYGAVAGTQPIPRLALLYLKRRRIHIRHLVRDQRRFMQYRRSLIHARETAISQEAA